MFKWGEILLKMLELEQNYLKIMICLISTSEEWLGYFWSCVFVAGNSCQPIQS